MKKNLMVLTLCVAVVFQALGVFAYEITPYISDGMVSTTSVSVKLEKKIDEGFFEEVSTVSEATNITASCNVKRGSDLINSGSDSVSVRLIIAAYQDGCYVMHSASAPVTITSMDSNSKALSVELDKSTVPDADDFKVFIWDNIDNARPLINKRSYGTTVIIGGQPVEFDSNNNADVEVNAGYVTWPDVIVLTDDVTDKVSVDLKGAFPLSKPSRSYIDSNALVEGTTEKGIVTINTKDAQYTIGVTQAVPQITDVQFYHWDKIHQNSFTGAATDYYTNAQLKIYYDIFEPEYTEAFPGPHKVAIEGMDMEDTYKAEAKRMDVVPVFTNRAGTGSDSLFFWCDISPELLGSQFFVMPYGTYSGQVNTANLGLESFTFTLDRSARVYMLCNSTEILDSGWKQATNRIQSSSSKQNIMAYVLSMSSAVYYSNTYANSIYYKDYDITPGETCKITLPAEKNRPMIFVKYKNTGYVTNPSYSLGSVKTDTETVFLDKPIYADKETTTNKYKLFNDVNSSTTTAKNNGNLIYSTATFLDEGTTNRRQFGLVGVPDSLVGSEALLLPFNANNFDKVDFDINQSSRVYVLTTAPNIGTSLGEGWSNTSFEYTEDEFNGGDIAVAFRSSDTAFNSAITNAKSYYRDYVVNPDEMRHISIPDLKFSGQKIIIVIQPLNE